HLALLDALGIADAVAVVTKTDAVPASRVAEVVAAVHRLLATTTLAGSPVIAASSVTGESLPAVREALGAVRDLVADQPPGSGGGRSLGIDRVFAIRGRGTVVTGTLRGDSLTRGAILRVVPGPHGESVRVREVQVHRRTVESAGPSRVALNVAGDAVARL